MKDWTANLGGLHIYESNPIISTVALECGLTFVSDDSFHDGRFFSILLCRFLTATYFLHEKAAVGALIIS
jgi:hypothetical protein